MLDPIVMEAYKLIKYFGIWVTADGRRERGTGNRRLQLRSHSQNCKLKNKHTPWTATCTSLFRQKIFSSTEVNIKLVPYTLSSISKT